MTRQAARKGVDLGAPEGKGKQNTKRPTPDQVLMMTGLAKKWVGPGPARACSMATVGSGRCFSSKEKGKGIKLWGVCLHTRVQDQRKVHNQVTLLLESENLDQRNSKTK